MTHVMERLWQGGWRGRMSLALLVWLVGNVLFVGLLVGLYQIKTFANLDIFKRSGWHHVVTCMKVEAKKEIQLFEDERQPTP